MISKATAQGQNDSDGRVPRCERRIVFWSAQKNCFAARLRLRRHGSSVTVSQHFNHPLCDVPAQPVVVVGFNRTLTCYSGTPEYYSTDLPLRSVTWIEAFAVLHAKGIHAIAAQSVSVPCKRLAANEVQVLMQFRSWNERNQPLDPGRAAKPSPRPVLLQKQQTTFVDGEENVES